VALDELRKLTVGNKEGASFSSKTSGLRLPVAGGRVKSYKGNEAEIFGAEGASVTSIYEGKVVEIKQNRITNKYEVYVAHGGYISSYSNMGSVCVAKGQKVAKNEVLGSIGSTINLLTFSIEYKINFNIHSPNAKETLNAETFFKK
jgi:murein DD-endopeptidase MepM/ murein hydrolase activator NlpD